MVSGLERGGHAPGTGGPENNAVEVDREASTAIHPTRAHSLPLSHTLYIITLSLSSGAEGQRSSAEPATTTGVTARSKCSM